MRVKDIKSYYTKYETLKAAHTGYLMIKILYRNNIRIDKKSYVTIKRDLNIYSVHSLYFIIGKKNGCFIEINANKCSKLVPTNKTKK